LCSISDRIIAKKTKSDLFDSTHRFYKMRCEAFTLSGHRCKRQARPSSTLCAQHDKVGAHHKKKSATTKASSTKTSKSRKKTSSKKRSSSVGPPSRSKKSSTKRLAREQRPPIHEADRIDVLFGTLADLYVRTETGSAAALRPHQKKAVARFRKNDGEDPEGELELRSGIVYYVTQAGKHLPILISRVASEKAHTKGFEARMGDLG
jgi:hypothetical protein